MNIRYSLEKQTVSWQLRPKLINRSPEQAFETFYTTQEDGLFITPIFPTTMFLQNSLESRGHFQNAIFSHADLIGNFLSDHVSDWDSNGRESDKLGLHDVQGIGAIEVTDAVCHHVLVHLFDRWIYWNYVGRFGDRYSSP